MEALTVFLSLIFIVFGVLQIILFFKLWGMTNDVRAIKKIIQPDEQSIIRDILKGSDVKNALFDNMFDEMYLLYKTGNDYTTYSTIIEKYQALYQRACVEFPERFKNITSHADFEALLR